MLLVWPIPLAAGIAGGIAYALAGVSWVASLLVAFLGFAGLAYVFVLINEGPRWSSLYREWKYRRANPHLFTRSRR